MTAEEARKLNDEYALTQGLSPKDINERIRQAAAKGKGFVQINLQKVEYSYRARVFERIKFQYEKRGFKVSRNKWAGDAREPTGYDVINISW